MATTDQLVDRGKVILSRVNDASLTAKLIIELVAAQERLEQEAFLPEFLYANQTISAVADEVDFATALTRFIRLHNNAGGVTYATNDSTALESYLKLRRFDEREQLLQRFPGALGTGGVVSGYFMVDTKVTLRPYPSASIPQSLKIHYYRGEATQPAAGNTNLWTQKAGDYLLGNAGKIIATSLRDQTALQVFQGLEATGKARLIKKVLGDEAADQDYTMGDED